LLHLFYFIAHKTKAQYIAYNFNLTLTLTMEFVHYCTIIAKHTWTFCNYTIIGRQYLRGGGAYLILNFVSCLIPPWLIWLCPASCCGASGCVRFAVSVYLDNRVNGYIHTRADRESIRLFGGSREATSDSQLLNTNRRWSALSQLVLLSQTLFSGKQAELFMISCQTPNKILDSVFWEIYKES